MNSGGMNDCPSNRNFRRDNGQVGAVREAVTASAHAMGIAHALQVELRARVAGMPVTRARACQRRRAAKTRGDAGNLAGEVSQARMRPGLSCAVGLGILGTLFRALTGWPNNANQTS